MPRKPQSPRDETDTAAPIEILPADLELADLVKQFPEARRVTIGRYNRTTDRWAHLGSVPSEMFSEDMIQRRWGGGLFQARFRNGNGHIIHSINAIEIEADPEHAPVAGDVDKAPSVNPPAPPAGDNALMAMMLAELQANRAMMLEMVRGMADRPAPPQNDLVGMVTALGALQGLQPKPTTPLPEKIVEKILEGALKGPATGGNEWVGLIKDVLIEFKPALQRALIQTAPASSSAAPTAAPIATAALPEPEGGEEDVTANGQDAAIGWLKAQYATGAKPVELGPIVLAFVDKAQIDLLLAKSDEQIFSEIDDPDLSEPGLRVWFVALFEGLRALRNIPNPGRTSGNAINADAHGGIS